MKVKCPHCNTEFEHKDPSKGNLELKRRVIVRCKECGSYFEFKKFAE